MKILILTPLYPPDIAEPAPYVKELASRLKKNHTIGILAYNHIPESIPGVSITVIPKKYPTIVRIIYFAYALIFHTRRYDILYIQNGPSTELPFLLARPFIRQKSIFGLSDTPALASAKLHFFRRFILGLALYCAHIIIVYTESNFSIPRFISKVKNTHILESKRPCKRPEILPFSPYPEEAFAHYEKSWGEHLCILNTIFPL